MMFPFPARLTLNRYRKFCKIRFEEALLKGFFFLCIELISNLMRVLDNRFLWLDRMCLLEHKCYPSIFAIEKKKRSK